uniref:Reticulon n=1 Tax=Paramormyrops kingsleyae TaxID=1676925 RepID=A0A3B3T4G7_9TELE
MADQMHQSPQVSSSGMNSSPSAKDSKLSVKDLVYWREPKKTGVVFGVSLILLLSLATFSVISVISYILLALLCVTITFRSYKSVIQAVQKSNDGHPFKLETPMGEGSHWAVCIGFVVLQTWLNVWLLVDLKGVHGKGHLRRARDLPQTRGRLPVPSQLRHPPSQASFPGGGPGGLPQGLFAYFQVQGQLTVFTTEAVILHYRSLFLRFIKLDGTVIHHIVNAVFNAMWKVTAVQRKGFKAKCSKHERKRVIYFWNVL